MKRLLAYILTALAFIVGAHAASTLSMTGFGGGGGNIVPPSISYITSSRTGSGGTTFTFTGLSTGLASGRTVFTVIGCGGGGTTTISNVTIDGNSMTRIKDNGSSTENSAIFGLAYTIGTNSTFVVTTAGSQFECDIGIYAAYNLSTLTPDDTFSVSANAALNGAVNTVSNGIAIGGSIYGSSSLTPTWGGTLINDYNTKGTANTMAGGNQLTTGATATMTYSHPGSFVIGGTMASFH